MPVRNSNAETPTREIMSAYLLEKASAYANMDNAEVFASHVMRNYSPAQQAELGRDSVEAAYRLLRSRLG